MATDVKRVGYGGRKRECIPSIAVKYCVVHHYFRFHKPLTNQSIFKTFAIYLNSDSNMVWFSEVARYKGISGRQQLEIAAPSTIFDSVPHCLAPRGEVMSKCVWVNSLSRRMNPIRAPTRLDVVWSVPTIYQPSTDNTCFLSTIQRPYLTTHAFCLTIHRQFGDRTW